MAQPSNAVNVLIHDANGKSLLQKQLVHYFFFLHRQFVAVFARYSKATFACGIVRNYKTTPFDIHLFGFPRFFSGMAKKKDKDI